MSAAAAQQPTIATARVPATSSLPACAALPATSRRALLLQMFVKSAVTLMPGQPDPYQHIGSLLTNASRLQAGRQLLLQPGRGFLQALAAQLGPSSSLARRRGCSGALRNCCISAEVGAAGHAEGLAVIQTDTYRQCSSCAGMACLQLQTLPPGRLLLVGAAALTCAPPRCVAMRWAWPATPWPCLALLAVVMPAGGWHAAGAAG